MIGKDPGQYSIRRSPLEVKRAWGDGHVLAFTGLISAALISSSSMATLSRIAPLELQVLAELNYARAHPTQYVSKLDRYRAAFGGAVVYDTAAREEVETAEGVRAVDEAISFVRRAAPKPPLTWDDDLAASAAEHAEDQRSSGVVGHEASDGSSFDDRMNTQAGLKNRMAVAEVISYGEASREGVVRQLIIDDGEPDRGHRKEVFDSGWSRAGVACTTHPLYGVSCVIDLSSAE